MDEKKLSTLLNRYARMCRSKRIFLKPNIPRIKILDAMGQFAFEAQDESSVLMVFDDTFFRNCSNGILVSKYAMFGRDRGGQPFRWDFRNDKAVELDGGQLHIDGRAVMTFRHLKRLDREHILSFARDIQALYLERPVPSLDRQRPASLLDAQRAVEAAVPDDIFWLQGGDAES
jgi:hypothetical protein